MTTIRDCYGANGDGPADTGRDIRLVEKNVQRYLPNGFVMQVANYTNGPYAAIHLCTATPSGTPLGNIFCEPGTQLTTSNYECGCDHILDPGCRSFYNGTYCSAGGNTMDFGGHESCMRQS
jgi:hypothetical protein